jgi:hypothetical protein
MESKIKKEFDGATRASVIKEMAKPRMTKSVREAEMKLVLARIAQGKLWKTKLSLLFPFCSLHGNERDRGSSVPSAAWTLYLWPFCWLPSVVYSLVVKTPEPLRSDNLRWFTVHLSIETDVCCLLA